MVTINGNIGKTSGGVLRRSTIEKEKKADTTPLSQKRGKIDTRRRRGRSSSSSKRRAAEAKAAAEAKIRIEQERLRQERLARETTARLKGEQLRSSMIRQLIQRQKVGSISKRLTPSQIRRIADEQSKKIVMGQLSPRVKKLVSRAESQIRRIQPIKLKAISVFDVVSGGSITDKRLNNDRVKLNLEIKSFNKKFGGRELSISESSVAKSMQRKIMKLENDLNKKRAEFESKGFRKVIGGFVFGKGKGSLEAKAIKAGGTKLLAGLPPPIIPAVSFGGASKVIFTGTTKNVGKYRLSKISFDNLKSGGKLIGKGNGVVITTGKGKDFASITIGSFAKKGGGRVKSFIGGEFGKNVNGRAVQKEIVTLLSKNRNPSDLSILKALNKLKTGRSLGVGKVIGIDARTGLKFPTGQLKTKIKINLDDFVSVSKSLSTKDLSFISGTSIANNKNKVEFFGLIRQLNKPSFKSFTTGSSQLKQYQQATQKIGKVIAAAVSQASKTSNVLPKTSQLSIAAKIIQEAIKKSPKKAVSISKIKTIQKSTIDGLQKVVPFMSIDVVNKIVSLPVSKTTTTLKSLQSSKSSTKQKVVTTPAQKVSLKKSLVNINSQIQLIRLLNQLPNIPFVRRLIVMNIPRRIRKDLIKKKKLKGKQFIGYSALVKSKNKFIRVNKIPLSKSDAKNRMAYVIDNSTAVTGKIKLIGFVDNLGKLNKKESGAFTKLKKRNFKIIKGKRKSTPNTYIELKGKPRINTRGEKKGLSARRFFNKLKKKKDVVDTKREKAQLSRLIKSKRKTIKRKTTKTTRVKRKR